MVAQKKGLGRGLSALFEEEVEVAAAQSQNSAKPQQVASAETNGLTELPLSKIVANKDQPRHIFNEDEIKHLAISIKSKGLIQPILVRPIAGGKYQIVAGERTPLPTLVDIWQSAKPRVTSGFLKILFVCIRDRLRAAATAESIAARIELLQQFFEVDAFHEGPFFRMLVELDECVRLEARSFGTLVEFDEIYAARLRTFLSGGMRRELPVETWTTVPLAVQRLLARRGHFLRHFTLHPRDVIAMECLPHLLGLENVTTYVATPSINGHLLAALAKEERLFQWEEPRFALVANPKAPGYVVMKFISYLRRDNLKRLATSHEGNQFSRQVARRLLERAT